MSEKGSHEHHPESYVHGVVDPVIFSTQRGIWAVKWSFLALLLTALFQVFIVLFSGSVALLADTVHNFGDAATAIPLWIAFMVARWKPSKRFTYGYGRVEDLAGVAIVVTILFSAIIAGYRSINGLFHPRDVKFLWAVVIASFVGFIGNEWVARFRIKVGDEIGSAALVADGYHARVDGLTSLAVFFGMVGVWLGYPFADPVAGIFITGAILRIVWHSGKTVFIRMLDGVDPEVIDEIKHAVTHVPDVQDISEIRVRWLGHRLHAEVNIAVNPRLTVAKGHEIAMETRHQLLHHLRYLSNVTVHIDPSDVSGEKHHRVAEHTHNDLPSLKFTCTFKEGSDNYA
jgi:cation diffusion facilitator family transporter